MIVKWDEAFEDTKHKAMHILGPRKRIFDITSAFS